MKVINYKEYDNARKLFNSAYVDRYAINLIFDLEDIYIFFHDLTKHKSYKMLARYSEDKTSSDLFKGFVMLVEELG